MADNIAPLSKSVSAQLSSLVSVDRLDDAARYKLTQDLQDLLYKVQPPTLAMRSLTGNVYAMVAIKVASGMGVFDAFADNSNHTMNLDELHSKTKGDKDLLLRTLRILAVNGMMEQVSKDEWHPTPVGAGFTSHSTPSNLVEHFHEMLRTHAILNEYLKKNEYRNPNDAFNGPWQYAYNTNKNYFGWLDTNDEAQRAFNAVMTIQQQFRGQNWFEFYPVEQNLTVPSDTDTLLVDIGGGVGHDAIAFREKFPTLKGQVILQDLPRVINSINKDKPFPPNMRAQPHDMFNTQPIQNAKAYYLRSVLHDWPDKQALQVLRRVREACSPTSLLLINENVVPEDHVSPMSATVDWVMMTTCSSLERTEAQWTKLITDAGFKLVKAWKPNDFEVMPLALFEAVPA